MKKDPNRINLIITPKRDYQQPIPVVIVKRPPRGAGGVPTPPTERGGARPWGGKGKRGGAPVPK